MSETIQTQKYGSKWKQTKGAPHDVHSGKEADILHIDLHSFIRNL